TWPGAATSRHHLRWLRTSWVIWLVLLAPWGGLCERRSRAADPTTSRVTTIRGQEGASQPGVHGPGYDARTPGWNLDILDDQDGEEDFESRSELGETPEFASPSPRILGFSETDPRRDDSGRSARSSIRRC